LKPRIALATAAHYPELAPDDQVLRAVLQRRGVDAEPVVWDSIVDWAQYDIVVARSIWDYHLKYNRYLQWLDALDESGAVVHNSTFLLRWNADKRYLLDLEYKRVRITPTRVVTHQDHAPLRDILEATGWLSAVIKPAVSSTGYETWVVGSAVTAEEEKRFERQRARMDVLVQEFARDVRHGEFSFVFIAGEYSHCILKRAATNEFRVHIEHGGTVESIEPTASQVQWARSVVATLGTEPWSYARVDAVRGIEGMSLMEFELLDPELFFTYNAAAAEKFADHLVGKH